jgi:hypothetical protein
LPADYYYVQSNKIEVVPLREPRHISHYITRVVMTSRIKWPHTMIRQLYNIPKVMAAVLYFPVTIMQWPSRLACLPLWPATGSRPLKMVLAQLT